MIARRFTTHRFRRIPAHKRPRGMAIVMVLGLLAITLAISYATLRGQGTTVELARNNNRSMDARVAAQSGLSVAIRKMSENSWGGIDSTIRSNITDNSWYQVTFSTGDAKLLRGDSLFSEYPFRVTIESTGFSADPLNASIQSQHKSRCVVQLVRKKMLAEPTGWSNLTSYNVYHFSNHDAYVQFPVRINGPVCMLGKLNFCTEYPGTSTARDSYLSGLNLRRLAGRGDDRPFPGAITLKGLVGTQDTATVTTMTVNLGTLSTEALITSSPPNHPGTTTTYTLFPGGKSYEIKPLQDYGSPLQNVVIAPDPEVNPLGVYRTDGSLTISSNVQFTGTIISDGSGSSDIVVSGTNVVINGSNMPALYGSASTYQLPSVLSKAALRMNSGSDAQINGTAVVWKEFEIKQGTAASKFALTGNLIADTVLLRGRTNWIQSPTVWSTDRTLFNLQALTGIPYFPDYEQSIRGFTVKPTLTFSSNSTGVQPHWHDWSQPIYQPDSADPGLKWEVVRWEDGS